MTKKLPSKSIYISGPMSGLPEHNYPAFDEAEKALKLSHRWDVIINPANHFNRDTSLPRPVYMLKDIQELVEHPTTAIYMLKGWQESRGARLEHLIAQNLDMKIYYQDLKAKPPIEEEAQYIVRNGLRQAEYGHPSQDFMRTSAMWSAILGVEVTPEDMALMMACLKISRLKSTPHHRDSLIDLIGYTICYDRLKEVDNE